MFDDISAVEHGMGRVKSRFVRALVESVQQETGGTGLARLRTGLPPYLLRILSRDVLGTPERDATMDLDGGIELLLAIDRVLCGGSGVVMARAVAALASRVLSQSTGLVVPGDAVATLQHLRAPFEHPFMEVEVHYSARRAPDGFVFELELLGHSRAVAWLCAAGLGYARAATRFSGQRSAPLVRFDTQQHGDQARVLARNTQTATVSFAANRPTVPTPALEERARPPLRRRSSTTNAAARVDEILSRGTAANGRAPDEPRLAKTTSAASPPTQRPRAPSGVRPTARETSLRARKNAS